MDIYPLSPNNSASVSDNTGIVTVPLKWRHKYQMIRIPGNKLSTYGEAGPGMIPPPPPPYPWFFIFPSIETNYSGWAYGGTALTSKQVCHRESTDRAMYLNHYEVQRSSLIPAGWVYANVYFISRDWYEIRTTTIEIDWSDYKSKLNAAGYCADDRKITGAAGISPKTGHYRDYTDMMPLSDINYVFEGGLIGNK